jgi:mutator protein MutT
MSLSLLREYILEVLGGNLTHGIPTTGHTGSNILDDEEQDNELNELDSQKLQAAICLIMSDDGMILAVSRKDNPTDFGLPGGKIDFAETAEEAAKRELWEETGLTASSLIKVFVHTDADGYETTTFLCDAEGEIKTDESGVIRWVKPNVLLQGCFASYNKKLFKHLNILY